MSKTNFSFVLSFTSVLGLFALAWFKGVQIETALISIVTGYVLGRSATKASHVWAASKDVNADTRSVIDKVEG